MIAMDFSQMCRMSYCSFHSGEKLLQSGQLQARIVARAWMRELRFLFEWRLEAKYFNTLTYSNHADEKG
jgi:hypothetical protein